MNQCPAVYTDKISFCPLKAALTEQRNPKPYLNPAYADHCLWQPFYSQREEEGDRHFDGSVQGHCDEHGAGGDGVSRQNIDGKGHKDNDLAAGKEGGHVESSQVGTFHYLTDFFPGRIQENVQFKGRVLQLCAKSEMIKIVQKLLK